MPIFRRTQYWLTSRFPSLSFAIITWSVIFVGCSESRIGSSCPSLSWRLYLLPNLRVGRYEEGEMPARFFSSIRSFFPLLDQAWAGEFVEVEFRAVVGEDGAEVSGEEVGEDAWGVVSELTVTGGSVRNFPPFFDFTPSFLPAPSGERRLSLSNAQPIFETWEKYGNAFFRDRQKTNLI